ncbi:hypothetical protein, partial [Klebsiella pneumoniae]|uniref:hypothetical protein n=1 Tax=Klebsiella pneumoniae TaxID=573 RepID=UPI001C6FC595
ILPRSKAGEVNIYRKIVVYSGIAINNIRQDRSGCLTRFAMMPDACNLRNSEYNSKRFGF